MKNTTIDSPGAYMEMFGLLATSNALLYEKQYTSSDCKHLIEVMKLAQPLNLSCLKVHLFSLLVLDWYEIHQNIKF